LERLARFRYTCEAFVEFVCIFQVVGVERILINIKVPLLKPIPKA